MDKKQNMKNESTRDRGKVIIALVVLAVLFRSFPAHSQSSIVWVITEPRINEELVDTLRKYTENKLDANDMFRVEVRLDKDQDITGIRLGQVYTKAGNHAVRSIETNISDTLTGFIKTLVQNRHTYQWQHDITSSLEGPIHPDVLIHPAHSSRELERVRWLRNSFWSTPLSFEISLPRKIALTFGDSRFLFFARIGDDALGFQPTSLGNLYAGFGFNDVKIYATLPVLRIADNYLEGAAGAGIEFESQSLGGRFQYGDLTTLLSGSRDPGETLHYLSTVLQLYGVGAGIPSWGGVLRYKIGAVSYIVNEGRSSDGKAVAFRKRFFYGGGYLRLEWASAFLEGGYPALETYLQVIAGNRSSVSTAVTWNLNRILGLTLYLTYTNPTESSRSWTQEFAPWFAAHVRF